MERADHYKFYVLVLTAVFLFAPGVCFARGMGGAAGGRGAGASFSSIGSRAVFAGPRAVALNPGARAFITARTPARNIQPVFAAARTGGRIFPAAANGRRVDFRHRRFFNSVPLIALPYQPYFGYPYCNTIYFRAYDCPAIYSPPVAPVYVPIPVPAYSDENPYDLDNNTVSLPVDNGYYLPPSDAREPATVSTASFNDQGDRAFHARDYVTALRDWQHAGVDDPGNGGLAMKLALAMFAAGKYPQAAGTTQHALSLLPQERWGEAFRDYKTLYASPNDYSDQLKSLAKASAAKPNDPALRFLLGFHYGYSGRVADAARELDKLVQLEPKDQLGRKLRDILADKKHKDPNPPTTMASGGIYTRRDSNGTVYFSNVPADLKTQPTTWQHVPY